MPGLFAVPIIAGWKAPTLCEWLILLTGLVVLIYTVETHALRMEMVRQNNISIQPLVIMGVKGPLHEERVILKNIGQGAALLVRIADVPLGEVVGDLAILRDRVVGNVAKFTPYNFIESGQEVVPQGFCDPPGIGNARYFDFMPSLIPNIAKQNYELTISYQDIDGRQHGSVM